MDADTGPDRPAPKQAVPTQGGTVEPANRAAVAKEKYQTPVDATQDASAQRFELRDPFAEITYRSNNLLGIVAKADQLGMTKFVAIDAQGKRSVMQKTGDEWQRAPSPQAVAQEPAPPTPQKSNGPTDAKSSKAPTTVEVEQAQTVSKIDAQAERAAQVLRLEAALSDRYLIKRAPVTVGDLTIGRTEYRFKGDTSRVAFTESTFRLATDTNSPSVARSMVDVAEARNWRGLRVSGNEDFKRMVWLEASVRGVKALGYEPNLADLDLLRKERESRLINRIELVRDAAPDRAGQQANTSTASAEKSSARGGGGRKAVLAAIEAVLIAKRVPDAQRQAVMAAATEQLAQRLREGQSIKVKVYDKAAPSQRQVPLPTPELQRGRERASPAVTR
jgi:Large polyvalent protein-associated domain 7